LASSRTLPRSALPVKTERRALGKQGKENERLRARLEELEETLRAIRSGEVDALVVETTGGEQIFTLKSADQTYRWMVEEMQKGAATLADDGVVLYCNPFLAALLDVPVEAVLGAPLSGFLDEQGAVSLSGLLRAAENGVSRGEVSFRRGGGSVSTHVSLTLLPLEGAHVFCMIVTDLTESKRREDERAQLEREQVARAAAEEANRTAQEEIERRKRIEESLRQAETQRTELLERERIARTDAETANRLKDEFLATLSHELRSPLNAIVAWSHILLEPGLDPATVSRAVQAIDRNARAQTQLVADILDVSRIVTGKFHMSLGPVRLGDVIESAADTVRPAARARDIRLELAIDPTAGPVSGDAGRLQQVIWNLLSNAVKFAPAGGRVQVRLLDAGSGIELSVTDDGPGIDPAFLPYVFDRFRQADSSSTRRHAGLGLGLAIVRHLVELHGGTVEARNREDRPGAVFIVSLPRPQAAPADRTPGESRAPTKAGAEVAPAAPSLENVSVLVVDDDDDTREAMAIGLGRYGARVATAASASEALGALERERPHVLVADIGMPGEDGHALLQRVRALPAERGGATPAIALTAYASPQDRVDALRTGFQLHLPKPVTPAELATVVATLVAETVRRTG
jgi:signal transduction histidine kinase/CheY-like chemotaxis protein